MRKLRAKPTCNSPQKSPKYIQPCTGTPSTYTTNSLTSTLYYKGPCWVFRLGSLLLTPIGQFRTAALLDSPNECSLSHTQTLSSRPFLK
eukprot:scaffold362_cov176-Amphora_coffeaeformis.AAC.21